jgi:ring-1,2-phenylacetyl-CoA epoxidase subunit PaaC
MATRSKIDADLVKRGEVTPNAGEQDAALFDYCQRLGDDALILGQRLGEWCGHAPALEVDLSLANIALDLIGQGTHFLGLAGDADKLAFHRDVLDWKNCWLVEQPNGDFGQTIAGGFCSRPGNICSSSN